MNAFAMGRTVLVTALALLLAGSVTYAASQHASPVYHGCYNKNTGVLRNRQVANSTSWSFGHHAIMARGADRRGILDQLLHAPPPPAATMMPRSNANCAACRNASSQISCPCAASRASLSTRRVGGPLVQATCILSSMSAVGSRRDPFVTGPGALAARSVTVLAAVVLAGQGGQPHRVALSNRAPGCHS